MCFIADEVVRYNFSDVAVHDARILKRMNNGEVRLWIISELGSHFLPMYCKVGEWRKQSAKEYALSAVEITVGRLLSNGPFDKRKNSQFFKTARFYLVTKGCDVWSGSVVPIDFRNVVDLVYCGKANGMIEG